MENQPPSEVQESQPPLAQQQQSQPLARKSGRKPNPKTLEEVDTQLQNISDQRKALLQAKKQLNAKAKTQDKEIQTRRKILVGALVLELFQKDDKFTFTRIGLIRKLDNYLTRPGDRELFKDLLLTLKG